jgi:hypothetical protein
MEVSGLFHAPVALASRKGALSIHWISGWVGLKASMEAVVKRNFHDPTEDRIPQAAARYFTDRTTQARKISRKYILTLASLLLLDHETQTP